MIRKVFALIAGLAVTVLGAIPTGAITIGKTAQGEWFPYFADVAARGTTNSHVVCGGSVIASNWILTASHCVDEGLTLAEVNVRLRSNHEGTTGQFYPAREIVLHPLWNGDVADGHDVALVRIDAYATSGNGGLSAITPVQVGAPADAGAYQPGEIATMVGRGRYYRAQESDRKLTYYETPLRTDSHMASVYDPYYQPWLNAWNPELMMGAGTSDHTICHGDSGAPLLVVRNGVTMTVGVASFVDTWWDHCDEAGVFAKLRGPQLAWIAAHVPVVAKNWGGCTTDRAMPGTWEAKYIYQSGGPAYRGQPMDGPFAWSITCMPTGPTGGTAQTPPSPAPTKPPPPQPTTTTWRNA